MKYTIVFIFSLLVSFVSAREIDTKNKRFLKEVEMWSKNSTLLPINLSFQPNENYFQLKSDNQLTGYAFVGRVLCFGNSYNSDSKDDDFEYFDYFAIFDNAISLQKIGIFNYQATYGEEITAKSWLKQFVGYNGDRPLISGRNVDAISGATSSVNALTKSLEQVVTNLKK